MYENLKKLQEYAVANESILRKVHNSSHTHNLLPGLALALYDNKYESFFTLPNTISPQIFAKTSKDRIIESANYQQFWEFLPKDLLDLFRLACNDIETIVLANTQQFMTFGKNLVILLSSSNYGSIEIPVHLHKTVLRPIVRKCLTVHVPLIKGTTDNTFVVHESIDAYKIREENLIHGDKLTIHLKDSVPVLDFVMPSNSLNIMYFSGAQMPHKVVYGNGLDLFFIFEDVEYNTEHIKYPSVKVLNYNE